MKRRKQVLYMIVMCGIGLALCLPVTLQSMKGQREHDRLHIELLESTVDLIEQNIEQEKLDNEGTVRQSLIAEYNEAKEKLDEAKKNQPWYD